jgi:AraC-like DNA-binding protein
MMGGHIQPARHPGSNCRGSENFCRHLDNVLNGRPPTIIARQAKPARRVEGVQPMLSIRKFSVTPGAYFFERDRHFLALLEHTVKRHCPDPDFDLQMLSVQMKASERKVQRKLRALLACTPSEYVRSKRLQLSLAFLKRGTTVSEAARAVGFTSQSYFASCFRAQYGETPSGFQKRFHRQGDTKREMS